MIILNNITPFTPKNPDEKVKYDYDFSQKGNYFWHYKSRTWRKHIATNSSSKIKLIAIIS